MILLNTKEKDLKYIMHTYGRYDVALKSGKGAVAYDENGKKYIDVSSGIGVNSLGYCNDGWVEAVTKQTGMSYHVSPLPLPLRCHLRYRDNRWYQIFHLQEDDSGTF